MQNEMNNKKKPMVSAVVSVHNGAKTLDRTIESLVDQTFPKQDYEILIVDNASVDATKDIIMAWSSKSGGRVRYLYEGKMGLSQARNKGISEAKGDIICFTDDDCVAVTEWLQELVKVFTQYNTDAVLGKVTLATKIPQDVWLPDWFIKQRMAHVDHGEEVKQIKEEDLVGANMSFKKDIFKKWGGFDSAEDLRLNQDTEFSRRITKLGAVKYYCPKAEIFHHYSISRLNERKLLEQSVSWGKAAAFVEHEDVADVRSFYYCILQLFKRGFSIIPFYIKRDRDNIFFTKCKIYSYWGRLLHLVTNIFQKN
ncbi:MAG: hypothetical protein A2Z88_10330 [Omnitrophica WOR_2 bacterium GWA2_47_8]|nr:MAG: hypothetical protein A2Z88_10330 [Omnitrophica WOR_2 bacterium GWA2_47_8]